MEELARWISECFKLGNCLEKGLAEREEAVKGVKRGLRPGDHGEECELGLKRDRARTWVFTSGEDSKGHAGCFQG